MRAHIEVTHADGMSDPDWRVLYHEGTSCNNWSATKTDSSTEDAWLCMKLTHGQSRISRQSVQEHVLTVHFGQKNSFPGCLVDIKAVCITQC